MELQFIREQIIDSYEGDPWFGRNISTILSEIDESIAFIKPSGQHSIIELLWHMINWREFAISRFSRDAVENTEIYETSDWKSLDFHDQSLLPKAINRFSETQNQLMSAVKKIDESILSISVPGRIYNYRKLLHGVLQHDIYHIGQIAFIHKMLKSED